MSVAACADLVARGDPDRFAAILAAPVSAREVLLPIYAFNLEVARAPWVTAEPMIAEMRLQWWSDVLDEIIEGKEVRRHEVTTPLAAAVPPAAARVLHQIVAARQWDIHEAGFDDTDALWRHLEHTGGALIYASALSLGASEESEPVLRDAGTAGALAAWFQAIPALEAQGKRPLPDGRAGAVQSLAREGQRRLVRARRGRHAVPGAAQSAVFPAWQAGPLLRRAVRMPGLVADGALGLSEFQRRAGPMWLSLTGRW